VSGNVAARPARHRIWGRAVEAGRTLFSFEAAFLAYVFAGNYKGAAALADFPIDITLMWFCVSVILGAIIVAKRWPLPSGAIKLALVGVVFCLFAVASLLWSPSVIYGRQKAMYVATLSLGAFLGTALVIGPERERVKRLATLLAGAGLVLALVVFVAHWRAGFSDSGRYLGLPGDSILRGRLVGFGTVVLAAVLLCWDLRWPRRLMCGVVLLFMAFVLMDIGSRGPILGAALAALLVVVLGFKSQVVGALRSRWGLAALGCSIGLAVVGLFVYREVFGIVPYGVTRLLMLPLQFTTTKAYSRATFFRQSLQLWTDRPLFGNGIGSFPVLLDWGDRKVHPHNIVLEVMAELGTVGLALYLWLVSRAFRAFAPVKRLLSEPLLMLVFMLAVYAMFNSLVNGDLHENRMLFMALGLCSYGAASMGQSEHDPQSQEAT